MVRNIEEITADLNKIKSKIKEHKEEIKKLEKKLISIEEEYQSDHTDHIKIVCPNCFGLGGKRESQGGLKICVLCDGKGYIWGKKYR